MDNTQVSSLSLSASLCDSPERTPGRYVWFRQIGAHVPFTFADFNQEVL